MVICELSILRFTGGASDNYAKDAVGNC